MSLVQETPRNQLCIVLVGLPARGKSTLALRLRDGLEAEGLAVRIFNNGNLRRTHYGERSSEPWFYDPHNAEGCRVREHLSLLNMRAAREYLDSEGNVAILDATNASRERRRLVEREMEGRPILYIECINDDPDLLAASIQRKTRLPEFAGISRDEAAKRFSQRIEYYRSIYVPLEEEDNFVRLDSLWNRIMAENLRRDIPNYVRVRDILVSDWVNNLYLVRHGETYFNQEGRIGGDSPLTLKGQAQARALADHFRNKAIPYIFTSGRLRSEQTALPLLVDHPESIVMTMPELDEIDGGLCSGMTYAEIREKYPEVYAARAKDKYNYCYPEGEGYASMRDRVGRGFRKALFLSGAAPGTLIIGHQAVNRMILAFFLYRQTVDVPYIYVPQDKYYHIVATHHKKLFELVRFMGPEI